MWKMSFLLTMVISSDTKYENFPKEICSSVATYISSKHKNQNFVIRTWPKKKKKNPQRAEFQSQKL